MKKYILFIFVTVALFSAKAQKPVVYDYSQEVMYAHLNATLFFPGEYLNYKLYCLDKEKNKLSSLSTIAYVELIGASKETVFKHRVRLEDGKGFSDFFIPTTLPSGNYKVVAYTQWMQNTGVADVFIADVQVINPYLSEKLKTTKSTPLKYTLNTKLHFQNSNKEHKTYAKIDVKLDKNTFGKREKVAALLVNNIAELGYGSYSISVRKVDEIPTFETPKAQIINKENFRKNGLLTPNAMLAPEREGYFLKGKILNTSTKIPASNIDVAISIPGDDFYFSVATTKLDGTFSFTIDPDFPGTSAILQVLDKQNYLYSIYVHENEAVDYSSLDFDDFEIASSLENSIINRSVYNQIENGYYSVKPDTLIAVAPSNSFVRYEKGVTYNLDHFKRFPTMTEVFTEIMKIVYTAKGNDGAKVVKVVERKFAKPTDDLAMLFIDGVFIPDHAAFLAFDALKVDKIKFVRNGYVFGKTDYQGVILVTTKNKDYKPSNGHSFCKENELFLPNTQKQYFQQSYDDVTSETLNRIPDYRLQLLWQPNMELKSVEEKVEFYTSDVDGIYKIALEGFTRNGTPISSETYFTVTN